MQGNQEMKSAKIGALVSLGQAAMSGGKLIPGAPTDPNVFQSGFTKQGQMVDIH
jgi:hypothetical protein